MIINALMMNPADNVVTTVTEINKGEDVCYMNGTKCVTLRGSRDGSLICSFSVEDVRAADLCSSEQILQNELSRLSSNRTQR